MGVVKEKTQQVKSPGEAPFTKSFERVGKSFEVFLSEARYFGQHMASWISTPFLRYFPVGP